MVNIELRRNSVFRDGNKMGSFYFPPNLFHLKLGNDRIRITHSKSGSLFVLLRHKGNFRYTQVAEMKGEILEYRNEKYSVAYKDIEGQIRPCILMGDKSRVVAYSNLDGSMEYSEVEDPVLEAVAILFLCIVRFTGTKMPDFSTYLAFLNKEFDGSFGKNTALIPAILIFTAMGTFALSRIRSTGVWALVVLAGFAFVLIGSYLYLFFEYFRKKITITKTKSS